MKVSGPGLRSDSGERPVRLYRVVAPGFRVPVRFSIFYRLVFLIGTIISYFYFELVLEVAALFTKNKYAGHDSVDAARLHDFVQYKVDALNKAVAKFIFDSSSHVRSAGNKGLSENFLALIEAVEEYERSRKEIHPVVQRCEFRSIYDWVRNL